MADDINLYDYFGGGDILGVVLAAFAAFFVGFVWFTFLFGKAWSKEMGIDMDSGGDFKSMLPSMIKDIVGNLLTAYVLWFTMMFAVPSVWAETLGTSAENSAPAFYGAMAAFFVWLGYYLPVALSRTGWEGRSWKWFGIDVGYQLVKLLVMGQILAALATSI